MKRQLVITFSLLLLVSSFTLGQEPVALKERVEQPTPEGLKFFEAKIRPVLVQRCYKCHSAAALKKGKLEGQLQLDTRAGMRQGGETGPAVVPGDVKASALLGAIRHDTFKMPPNTKLRAEVIADFVKWVEMGAPDPRDGQAVAVEQVEIDIEAGRKFWSFQPLQTSTPPKATRENARTFSQSKMAIINLCSEPGHICAER